MIKFLGWTMGQWAIAKDRACASGMDLRAASVPLTRRTENDHIAEIICDLPSINVAFRVRKWWHLNHDDDPHDPDILRQKTGLVA